MPQLIFYILIGLFVGLNAIAKWLSKQSQCANPYLRNTIRIIMILTILYSIGFSFYVFNTRDIRAFKKLKENITIEKAQDFIRKYPHSDKITEARGEINRLYEEELRLATDSLGLSNFIDKYSNNYRFHEEYKQPFLDKALTLLELEKKRLEHERNERMKKEKNAWSSESQAWKTASESGSLYMYQKYLNLYPDGIHSSQAKKKIIDLEVSNVFLGNNYGSLPSMDKIGYERGTYTTISVTNNTQYTLTLLYSGIESRRVVIKARGTKNIRLKSGSYRIVASVDTGNVQNFAGSETLTGGSYQVSYYITTSGGYSYGKNY